MSNMVKSEEMHNHNRPIVVTQFTWDMPRHVIVHLSKVGNEEASRTIRSSKEIWKEFQPSIVSIHDQLALLFRLHLSQPRVLVCQGRSRIRFSKVEDNI